VLALFILQAAVLTASAGAMPELNIDLPSIEVRAAALNFGLSLVLGLVSIRLITSERARHWVARLTGPGSLYDPQSGVHVAAMVLSLSFVSILFSQLVSSGGLSGLAEDVSAAGIPLSLLLMQAVVVTLAAFLGVGLSIRRDLSGSLARLGLRVPTTGDITSGVIVGIGLYGVAIALFTAWSALAPAEQIAEQSAASDAIVGAFSTLPAAFALAALAAISEEILFRGALQPVFGIGLTSVLFALFHNQYALTPATLIILAVAVGLGILRQRQSTAAAIIAHFVYNFVQLALAILAAQMLGGG
jgi:membrane protease YdiL (CAAX protease family)